MPDEIQIKNSRRRHGAGILVYLPGLHGNWTLIPAFRNALAGRVRFVELSYPPTLTWSMEDYAAAVESTLALHGITAGWLLAESFSSQVVWRVLARDIFKAKGLILAGGFVRRPAQWGARLAERMVGDAPLSAIMRVLFGYARVSRLRFRRSPETTAGIREFVARSPRNNAGRRRIACDWWPRTTHAPSRGRCGCRSMR